MLCRRFNKDNIDVGLLQEPWVNGGKIRGLPTHQCKALYHNLHDAPRAAIIFSNRVNFFPVYEFMSRDLAVALVDAPMNQSKRQIIIASAYFPGDTLDPPPEEVQRLIDWCSRKGTSLLLGCDANAHHTIWGSTDDNPRGEYLLEYISTKNIDIINRGNEPTFITAVRKEVLDVTLASPCLHDVIKKWHVSPELSMSDHRHIRFDLVANACSTKEVRIPKLTDWDLYKDHLKSEIDGLTFSILSQEELNIASGELQNIIMCSYEKSCPVKRKANRKEVPWWNNNLAKLKTITRRAFNTAKSSGNWEEYRKALTDYNKELRRSKRNSWKLFCEGVKELAPAVRLQKVLSKDHSNQLGLVKKKDGSYTNSSLETIKVMLDTHFPGSRISDNQQNNYLPIRARQSSNRLARQIAGKLFTDQTIKWAIESFKPFKSPGVDGIFPALLQKGIDYLLPHIKKIFKSSFIMGHIPENWTKVKVVFIPKAGRRPSYEPKSYRPISLSSFFLKAMEKIVDHHIRSEYISQTPLHKHQFAYQPGKSTVNALHTLVKKIEKTIKCRELALCAFIDIEGAYDNTSHESVKRAAESKGIDEPTIKWIDSMLTSREIMVTLGDDTLIVTTQKGCPQGGVVSPLIWSIVIDDLLIKLTQEGFDVQGYADDLVITIRGKHDLIISDRMQSALNLIKTWCNAEGLGINPNKTIIVPFTKRRKLNLRAPSLDGTTINFSSEAKYLGVTLDHRLNWNAHLDKTIARATVATWSCRKLLGKTWGLKPKLTFWSYITIVRPIITYASLVWWHKAKQNKAQAKLQKLQRIACTSTTGANKTCPTAALETMLGLLPLHLHLRREAILSAWRLSLHKSLLPGDLIGHLEILNLIQLESMHKPSDVMQLKRDFEIPYKVIIQGQKGNSYKMPKFERNSQIWYTDGSKMDDGVGMGIVGPNCRFAIPMGSAPSIFQAEIAAINHCAGKCITDGITDTNIYILSDSQAALQAIGSNTCNSRLVWQCKQSLKELTGNNRLSLVWVPSHQGIEGNESADQLAREGATSPLIGPEPFCGLPKSQLMADVNKWERDQLVTRWRLLTGLRQAKLFIRPHPNLTKQLLELNRRELKMVTSFLTGHGPFGYQLNKTGQVDNDTCRFCDLDIETAEHVLCNCAALARTRYKYTGRVNLNPQDVQKMSPFVIAQFAKSINIWNY